MTQAQAMAPSGSVGILRCRPWIEGLFARIERRTNTTDSTDIFWRSISKDNISN